jgi:hypothetical protein
MDQLRNCWTGTETAKPTFETTLFEFHRFLKQNGMSDSTGLQSSVVLAPLLYFFHHTDADPNALENTRRVRRYILATKVSGIRGQNSNWVAEVLHALHGAIQRSEGELSTLPYSEVIVPAVNDSVSQTRLEPAEEEIVHRVDSFRYSSTRGNIQFLLSYLRNRFEPGEQNHLDHIFQQSLFCEEVYDELGLSTVERDAYDRFKDSVWNLEILRKPTHDQKSNWYEGRTPATTSVAEWLTRSKEDILDKRDTRAYCEEHDIPLDDSLHYFGRFLEFIQARRKLMLGRLLPEFDYSVDDIDTAVVDDIDLRELGHASNTHT